MSAFDTTEAPIVAKCNTCKAEFNGTETVREHYRTDWHVLNSKRRANNLAPLSLAEYNKNAHKLKANKKKPIVKSNAIIGELVNTIPAKPIAPETHLAATATAAQASTSSSSSAGAASTSSVVADDSVVVADEDVMEEDTIASALPRPPMGPTVSLFDGKEFSTTDECIAYMSSSFGFFVPDKDYLEDKDGLLEYLSEKIKLGYICIYCQKQCTSYRACQQHMVSKSHCKIAYEQEIDLDEFEDFYDFSSTYEDCGSDEGSDDDEETAGATLSEHGELVLEDGRIVGHRSLKKYYKQHYKAEDCRPEILANQKEQLLKLTNMYGASLRLTEEETRSLTQTHMMSLLTQQQHKDLKKSRLMEERARTTNEFRTRRRAEYNSTVDKLRSSINTTAKIRDYHGRLQ